MASTNDAAGKKDIWDVEAYTKTAAPFVPQLTTTIVSWLDPQPTDTILDIGCGDGLLTARLAPLVGSITGIDSSGKQIAHLKQTYPSIPAYVLDCSTSLSPSPSSASPPAYLQAGTYTKLFSNAALHWILRAPTSREPFFRACRALLEPGGVLVSESGAHGNVAEVHSAIVLALALRAGVAPEKAREASPWYFPTLEAARRMVEDAGLEWVKGEVELRQTVLTEETAGGGKENGKEGGVRGWVRLFGAPFAEVCEGGSDGEVWGRVVEDVAAALEGVGRREDGSFSVNYVRLRFVARRPV